VQYWEPAKFAQRLRQTALQREGSHPLQGVLLKTDMTSGHFSASDRYANLKEEAYTFAWALSALGQE
jgi:oligopeptidase B